MGRALITTSVRELRVIACLRFDGDGPGFALPLLEHPTNGGFAVQEVDEYSLLIAGFRVLVGELAKEIKIVDGPMVRIFGPQIYAFITEDGIPHAGTLTEIEPILRDFLSRCPDRVAISLQIAELIGTSQEQHTARTRMRHVIRDRSGAASAHSFYEVSALHSALWDRVVKGAPSAQAADRILRSRSRIHPTVRTDGAITIDLSLLDPKDYSGTTSERIEEMLSTEFIAVEPGESVRQPSVSPAAKPRDSIQANVRANSTVFDEPNPSSHVETASELPALRSSNEAEEWLAAWRNETDAGMREMLAARAVELLRVIRHAAPEWSRIWHTVWRYPGNDRRIKLYSMAVSWLKEVSFSNQSWSTIWSALWRFSKNTSKRPNDELTDLAIRWLDVDPLHVRWAAMWRKIWEASLEGSDLRTRLGAFAVSWLEQTSIAHLGWASVWRALWDEYRNTDSSQHLMRIGVSWLEETIPTHSGWPSVWQRLVEPTFGDSLPRDQLIRQGRRWLEINPLSDAWPIVWQKLLETAARDTFLRDQLIDQGQQWLEMNSLSDAWPILWQKMIEAAAEDAYQRDRLIDRGQQWLEMNSLSDAWPVVWQKLIKAAAGHRVRRDDLIYQGKRWLAMNPLSNAWPAVWLRLIEMAAGDSLQRSELIYQGEQWLSIHPLNDAFPFVKQKLIEASAH